MVRKCFDCDVELNTFTKNGSSYAHCLIRRRDVLLTPEEEVRQAVLSYLLKHPLIDFDKFKVRVEHQCLDLAFYKRFPDTYFQPCQPPFLIFELKRVDAWILGGEDQLKSYMQRFCCNHGVLTNSDQILHVKHNGTFVTNSLTAQELALLISAQHLSIDEDLKHFRLAQHGDFESFKALVIKYGKSSRFNLLCREYIPAITCSYLELRDDYVLYDISGYKAIGKQKVLQKGSFLRLLYITE